MLLVPIYVDNTLLLVGMVGDAVRKVKEGGGEKEVSVIGHAHAVTETIASPTVFTPNPSEHSSQRS